MTESQFIQQLNCFNMNHNSWRTHTKTPQTLEAIRNPGVLVRTIIYIVLVGLIIASMTSCTQEKCISQTNKLVGYGKGGYRK